MREVMSPTVTPTTILMNARPIKSKHILRTSLEEISIPVTEDGDLCDDYIASYTALKSNIETASFTTPSPKRTEFNFEY